MLEMATIVTSADRSLQTVFGLYIIVRIYLHQQFFQENAKQFAFHFIEQEEFRGWWVEEYTQNNLHQPGCVQIHYMYFCLYASGLRIVKIVTDKGKC
jgi:hypothetical protein